jgi:hypothetical protein
MATTITDNEFEKFVRRDEWGSLDFADVRGDTALLRGFAT